MSPPRPTRARPLLAPSILSADFTRLGEEIGAAEEAGAGLIHVDVMDGHFVPNLTIGPAVAGAVRRSTRLPVDCHLMVSDPDRWIEGFAEAGADMISVHVESAPHLDRTLRAVRQAGLKAGVALNPATPVAALDEALTLVDFVLVMSVNPGFGGQTFLPAALRKLGALRERIDREMPGVLLEIDGGVGLENIDAVVDAGADWIVAGSAVFGGAGASENARRLIARLEARHRGATGG